jgi:hypothetical protein
MGDPEDTRIELFVFPDGTEIEVMVFERAGGGGSTRPPARRVPRARPAPCNEGAPEAALECDPGVCPVCGGHLVYPVDWRRSGEAVWDLSLRCPDCETRRTVTLGRESVEELNRRLYRGNQAVAREAQQISRRNFEEEAEKLISALETGLIQPMDF